MSKNCIFCGAEIDDDDLFCGECGKKQDPEEKKRIEQAEAEAKAKAEAEMRLKREQAEREAQQRQAQIDKETEMRIRAEAEAKAKLEFEERQKREEAERIRNEAERKKREKEEQKLAKQREKNSPEYKAVMGRNFGICSILFLCTYIVPAVLVIPGLIYSANGLKAEKKANAIAGIILNLLVLFIAIYFMARPKA